MYVFGYGSLLNVDSLLATLPDVPLADCHPGALTGHVRTFDVAFPNDGSQPDKAYIAADGQRPGVVLFANLRRREWHGSVNGILIPVTLRQAEILARRERRYEAVDVAVQVGGGALDGVGGQNVQKVRAFVGRPEFTHPTRVAAGVLAQDYLDCIDRGVEYWERRHPGFRTDFENSTQAPRVQRVLPLRRVERPVSGP